MIEVGVATQALGAERSGDREVVLQDDDGVLLAAIDGLGHGEPAAEAADLACQVLSDGRHAPLEELFVRCHEALQRTRGVVMTVARIDRAGAMEWVGLGNVEARLVRSGAYGSSESPVLFGGILGGGSRLMRRPRGSSLRLERGDLIVMATDGVRADFAGELSVTGSAQAIADGILERKGRGNDDALVLVVRWLGASG